MMQRLPGCLFNPGRVRNSAVASSRIPMAWSFLTLSVGFFRSPSCFGFRAWVLLRLGSSLGSRVWLKGFSDLAGRRCGHAWEG